MRATLVGLRLTWPITPLDELCVVPEPLNEFDTNALKVLVKSGTVWHEAGYINRDAAALLRERRVKSICAITAGDGWSIPVKIECVS